MRRCWPNWPSARPPMACFSAASSSSSAALLLALAPSAAYGHFGRGQALKRLGRRNEARTHLRIAVALAPGSRIYRSALDRLRWAPPPSGRPVGGGGGGGGGAPRAREGGRGRGARPARDRRSRRWPSVRWRGRGSSPRWRSRAPSRTCLAGASARRGGRSLRPVPAAPLHPVARSNRRGGGGGVRRGGRGGGGPPGGGGA